MILNANEHLWLRTYGAKLRDENGRTFLELGAIAVVISQTPKMGHFDQPRSTLTGTHGTQCVYFFQNSAAEQSVSVKYLGLPYEVRGTGELDITNLRFSGSPMYLPILPSFAKNALLRAASENPVQPRIRRSRTSSASVTSGYEKTRADVEYEQQQIEREKAERHYHDTFDKSV